MMTESGLGLSGAAAREETPENEDRHGEVRPVVRVYETHTAPRRSEPPADLVIPASGGTTLARSGGAPRRAGAAWRDMEIRVQRRCTFTSSLVCSGWIPGRLGGSSLRKTRGAYQRYVTNLRELRSSTTTCSSTTTPARRCSWTGQLLLQAHAGYHAHDRYPDAGTGWREG